MWFICHQGTKLRLPVFVLWVCNIFDRFYMVNKLLEIIWYRSLNLVLIVLFLIEFCNQKLFFPGSLNFSCLLYSLIELLFQCVVSIFYRGSRRLSDPLRRDRRSYRLVVYEIDAVQVVIDVQSLERLENLQFVLSFVTCFKPCSSFLQSLGLKCRSLEKMV